MLTVGVLIMLVVVCPPGDQTKVDAPVALSVVEVPLQTVSEGFQVIDTVGEGFTVMFFTAVFEHPIAFVPVTV